MTVVATNRLKPGAENEGPPPGPGPQLRDARCAKKLSIEEAARRLKLEAAILEALERDDYSSMAAPLYVRGYLTGYARLLDVPEQDVLDRFRQAQGQSASPVISVERSLGRQARSSDRGVRWFSYGFGIAILAVATYWGYERWLEDRWVSVAPMSNVESTGGRVTPSPVDAEIEPTESRQETIPLKEAARDVVTPGSSAAKTAVVEADRPETNATESTAGTTLGIGGPDPLLGEGETTLSGSEAVVGGAQVPGQEAAGSESTAAREPTLSPLANVPAAPVEAVVGDRLELAFNRDCWVEIRDATDERLAFGLAKSGSVRRYAGQAPFRITLGDSGGVSILFNGRLVEPETYKAADGRPARFTLGGADSPA